MTRGHSSHIGVGTVIELFGGYVIDYVVLSSFCLGCEVGPKPGTNGYEEWSASQKGKCQKNTESKSGQMEVEAALILFQRSFECQGLCYTTMLCDSDRKTFSAIQGASLWLH